MSDEEQKPPLEYRNLAEDRPRQRGSVAAFILGMFAGVVLLPVCVFAAILYSFNEGIDSTRPTAPTKLNPAVWVFGSIAAATIVLGILLLRRQPRRFMLIGFLLGIALGSIIEGICFVRS